MDAAADSAVAVVALYCALVVLYERALADARDAFARRQYLCASCVDRHVRIPALAATTAILVRRRARGCRHRKSVPHRQILPKTRHADAASGHARRGAGRASSATSWCRRHLRDHLRAVCGRRRFFEGRRGGDARDGGAFRHGCANFAADQSSQHGRHVAVGHA